MNRGTEIVRCFDRGRAEDVSAQGQPDQRFIGRVDSGTQIIVFSAAGTAMPASQQQRHRPSGLPEMGSR
jgi:hypothetical protein